MITQGIIFTASGFCILEYQLVFSKFIWIISWILDSANFTLEHVSSYESKKC